MRCSALLRPMQVKGKGLMHTYMWCEEDAEFDDGDGPLIPAPPNLNASAESAIARIVEEGGAAGIDCLPSSPSSSPAKWTINSLADPVGAGAHCRADFLPGAPVQDMEGEGRMQAARPPFR